MNNLGKENEKQWLEEFKYFVTARPSEPSPATTRRALSSVRNLLEPRLQLVFTKAILIHAVAFFLVLLFCPQLGIGPIKGGQGIMSLFMAAGELGCAGLCGATLLGLSSLLTTLILRKEELKVASAYGYLYIPAVSSITFSFLMLLGASGERITFATWLLGAIGIGWLVLRLGAIMRWRTRLSL
jgi:hypothetical protein